MEFFSLMNTIYTNQVFIYISAIFCGDLSTTVPQDGRLKRAGYSNMKLVTQRLAFGRIKFLDFDVYDAIVLRIRGDGRTYMFNIHTHEFLDVNWMDLYSFPVHTRGGTYQLQLNRYETAPNFIQLTQNLTSDCLLI